MSKLISKSTLLTTHNLERCRFVVKELMAQHRINATELARRIGLPQPTIHRLLSGDTIDPKLSTLTLIAEYFSVSIDQLLGNAPFMGEDSKTQSKVASVPVISWETAVNPHAFVKKAAPANWEEWTLVDTDVSSSAFALRSKRSMEPRFPTGSILVVDPQITPQDGDLIIVHYPDTTEATIREILLDGPKQELHSILELSKCDELNDKIQLIGVIVQTRFTYK